MDRIDDELVERFCAHGITATDLEQLSFSQLAEQIEELRDADEPFWLTEMSSNVIAARIRGASHD
jgi:enoyl reductase-like protein